MRRECGGNRLRERWDGGEVGGRSREAWKEEWRWRPGAGEEPGVGEEG